jgi:hypothetical protein
MNEKDSGSGYRLLTGLITGHESGQQLPGLFLLPAEDWNEQLVIWLTDRGKAGLLGEADQPTAAVRQLLAEGYAVAGIDLIGQGEFVADGDRLEHARLHTRGEEPWQHAACYTFGYNRPLFAQRVQDVLATIKAAQGHERPPATIHLVGIGREAGPVTLAARAQAGDSVSKTAVQTGGFDFHQITRIDDPMFVPGAVRYEGVGGLRKLAGNNLLVEEGALDNGERALQTTNAAIAAWLLQE